MYIGQRIKEERIKNGLSQVELADRLGTTKQAIFKYESGLVTNIPLEKIESLAKIFDVTPAYLMGWDESHSNNTINGNNNIIGDGNTITTPLTESEMALLDMFNQMDIVKKSKLIAYASELLKEL